MTRRGAISLAAGLSLVGLPFLTMPGLAATLGKSARAFGLWGSVAIVALTFANTLATAAKWRLISRQATPKASGSLGDFILFVSSSAVAGLVLPRQAGVIGTRVVALRSRDVADLSTGFRIVLSDLASDLVVPATLLAPTVLYVAGVIPGLSACALSVGVLALTVATAAWWQSAASRAFVALAARFRWATRRRLILPPSTSVTHDGGSQFPRIIAVLAIAKFGIIILRACVVARASGLPISPWTIALVAPMVQLAFVVAVTPAGLGIADWSWIGSLGLAGIPFESAAAFALMLRVANSGAVLLIAGLVWIVHRLRSSRLDTTMGGDPE